MLAERVEYGGLVNSWNSTTLGRGTLWPYPIGFLQGETKMSQQWYVMVNEKAAGPFSSAQLKQAAASGKILPTAQVRQSEEGKWVPAKRIKGLFAELPTQTTAAPHQARSAVASPLPPASDDDKNSFEFRGVSPSPTRPRGASPHSNESGFIASNLLSGESILSRGRIHPAIFFKAVPSGLVLLPAIITFAAAESIGLAIVGALFGLFAFMLLLLRLVDTAIIYLTTEIALTDKRVLGKTGFIRRESIELFLTKIEGIEVKQGIIARCFNFGDLSVTGTGATATRFPGIVEPLAFRRRVQEQVDVVQRN